MFRLTVAKGTGRKAEVKDYFVGGKTGTAEKAINGKYDKSKNLSSFFGMLPAYNPKYVVYVIFDEPHGIKESFGFRGGGWVAAPTAGAIFERMAVLYGMNKQEETSPEIRELMDIDYMINGDTYVLPCFLLIIVVFVSLNYSQITDGAKTYFRYEFSGFYA